MKKSVSTWYEILLFARDEIELFKGGWYIIDWGLTETITNICRIHNTIYGSNQHVKQNLQATEFKYIINISRSRIIDRSRRNIITLKPKRHSKRIK